MASKAKKRIKKKAKSRVTKKPKGRPARARSVAGKRKPARKVAARADRTTAPNPLRVLARRIVDLTVTHDDEGAFALYSENVESTEPGMPPAVGIGAIRQKFQMWRGMVSDSSWRARNVWVERNCIIIEWSGEVTFAATGKRASLNEVAIHEIEGGKIVRERFYYDRSALQP
jgi:ketosteroid isomerase-like protein